MIQNIKNISLPFLLLNCLAGGFLLFFYGAILANPNGYMFSQTGDGLKNYFTYAYHIKHSNSVTNFEGMNYPYGENFLYTDCHPILTYLVQKIAMVFPTISDYSIGILNFIILTGFFFTFWVLYFLLKELKLKQWFALLFSITIFLMIPQVERIAGHYALSYALAFPLSWLLLLKHQKKPNILNTLL